MSCVTFASTNSTDISYTGEVTCGSVVEDFASTPAATTTVIETGVVSGTDVALNVLVGMNVRITDTATPAVDGVYPVIARASDDEFTVPAFMLGAALSASAVATIDGPAFQLMPTTGGSPTGNTTTAVSEVIRSDRQIDDLVVVSKRINI